MSEPPVRRDRTELHLIGYDAGAQRAWSYTRDGARVTLEDGAVGAAPKQQVKELATEAAAATFVAKAARAKIAKGYHARELVAQIASVTELAGELVVSGHGEPDDRVLVFPGDVVVPHDLLLDFRWGLLALPDEALPPFAGVLVRGNLIVEGCFVNTEDDFGPFLQVQGDLVADAIATGGSQIHVGGDLRTTDLVGVYNHGSVHVAGALTARTIATEHTVSAGRLEALRYLGWGAKLFAVHDGVEDRSDPYDAKGVFVTAVLKQDGVDLRKARELIAAGKPIALPAFTSIRAAFRKLVARKLDAPDKVKSLSLAYKDLPSLPDELFRFCRLEKLDLKHNKLRALPDEIGQLTELRELSLRLNDLQTLPDSIGQLRKLRSLDLESNCIWRLPDSLAQCTELRSINLTNNPHAYVRRAFGGWANVQLMWALPEVLTYLPRLETLIFNGSPIRTLPSRRFDSPTLGPVILKGSLVLDVDPELHAQLTVPVEDSPARAVAYIRFWFDRDYIKLETFYDLNTQRYEFAAVEALLALLLRITIPTAAPYADALATWEAQSERIEKDLTWSGKFVPQARALFGALRDALDRLGEPYGDNALISGLRAQFGARA